MYEKTLQFLREKLRLAREEGRSTANLEARIYKIESGLDPD